MEKLAKDLSELIGEKGGMFRQTGGLIEVCRTNGERPRALIHEVPKKADSYLCYFPLGGTAWPGQELSHAECVAHVAKVL